MTDFNLPDLGEGLPDAEIREWYVKVGDTVTVDQPLVSMETAKAVVDVPAPLDGVIATLHGEPGDVIPTGRPLVSFVSDAPTPSKDQGTVVGNIEIGKHVIDEPAAGVGATHTLHGDIKAAPAARALAHQHGIDLTTITPTGSAGIITTQDIKTQIATPAPGEQEGERLQGARRTMASVMQHAGATVVPAMICEDANVHHWTADTDKTIQLILATVAACKAEPNLNAAYHTHTHSHRIHEHVHLGIAVDTPKGLFVPVIRNADQKDPAALRAQLNDFKEKAKAQCFTPDDLSSPTLTLSNVGSIAGRYATPVIVPPTVAILAVGRARDTITPVDGQPAVRTVLPLSLTFDHRVVTGGEAARFLATFIDTL